MFKKIKEIFNNYFNDSNNKKEESAFSISKNINNIGYDTYKNISQAIEATKGNEYFIHEKIEDKFICRGKWKEYKHQDETV